MQVKSLVSNLVLAAAFGAAATTMAQSAATNVRAADASTLERGRYLVVVGGCNDCHTPGYAERAGQVPPSEWLTGGRVGFQGPWGTTYPANLRAVASSMTEEQWVQHAVRPTRPPMPWFNLRDMSESDLRAIYRFVTSLGPKGEPVPAYVPPGATVRTPYIVFVPQNLPAQQASR